MSVKMEAVQYTSNNKHNKIYNTVQALLFE
jgi:hypothetical protein